MTSQILQQQLAKRLATTTPTLPLQDPLANAIRHPHDVGLNSRLEVATMELRDSSSRSVNKWKKIVKYVEEKRVIPTESNCEIVSKWAVTHVEILLKIF